MYGDSAAARRRVAQLREQGEEIRALAERLVARSDAVPWHGRAADAMRDRVRERAAQLRAVAERHQVAADTLAVHVGRVDAAKEAIAATERRVGARRAEAQERVARAADDPELDPDPDDEALLALELPPSGHKDWLATSSVGR